MAFLIIIIVLIALAGLYLLAVKPRKEAKTSLEPVSYTHLAVAGTCVPRYLKTGVEIAAPVSYTHLARKAIKTIAKG